MKSTGLILTVFLAVSCNGTAGTDMPEWRWPDKEEPAFVEPYPAIVSLGWTNVTADYSSLPEGMRESASTAPRKPSVVTR